MKRRVAIFLATFLLASAAALPDTPGATEISVGGTGTIALPPDLATIDAAIETNALNAGEAVAANNTIYARVVAALERLGLDRADVTLAYYNVSYAPKPPPGSAGESASRWGHTVSRGFHVKVRAIDKAGAVADACTAAGATAINGVTFGLADERAARAQATAKAVDDARANGEALAAAARLHIVGIKRIDLTGGPIRPEPMMRMAANAPATQFDQSNVNVSVSVDVTFLASP